MNHQPTISVLIPAYNAAGCVSNAIESVLAQTVPPVEILVVDDGSADRTAEVIAGFGPPVRLLRQRNAGPAAARNHAAREAQGDWLALLDADDAWLPEKLERQLQYTGDPAVGLIHCWGPPGGGPVPDRITLGSLWERNCIVNSSVLVRRTAFEQVGGFDEDRGLISVEDYNLWLRLLAAGWTVATCPQQLHAYTPAPGNLSGQFERFARAELLNLEKLTPLLGLEEEAVRRKRLAIHDDYGRHLFHYRQLGAARGWLAHSLRTEPSATRLAWWLATFAPPAALNFRRRLHHSEPAQPTPHG
ncbi:MAG: glycosyltransferase family 2 protein [Actinomycetota bacterium]